MIIEDIDKMLDMQCVISFSLSHPITDLSEEYGLTSVIKIRMRGDGGTAILNIPYYESETPQEIIKVLKEHSLVEDRESMSAKIDLSGTRFLQSFRELIGVPSVVIDAMTLDSGIYSIIFRFHSNDSKKINKVIQGKFSAFDRFAVTYYGESPGLISTFEALSLQFPLKYVEITTSVPPRSMDIERDPVISTLGVSWERELKYLVEEEIRAVYYDKNAILRRETEWVNEISPEQRIYETSFSNPIMEFYIKESSKSSVVILGMPQKLEGKNFSFSAIVPEMSLHEFFSVITQSIDKFPEWDIMLSNVSDFVDL